MISFYIYVEEILRPTNISGSDFGFSSKPRSCGDSRFSETEIMPLSRHRKNELICGWKNKE